jgi:serine/threonine-protein kinase
VQHPKTKQIWSLKHVKKENEKDERFLDQAISEYEVAQRFKHPSIREIVSLEKERAKIFSTTDVFLVMEYVDGVSLERRPKSVTLDVAVQVFCQTAAAMLHMHEKGYVHADMKPNNIMVTPGPIAKIIDLGQSCPIGTVKKRIQGTPDYIAPEQAQLRPITPVTDVFNLGATMYWVLSGKAIPTMMNQPEGLTQVKDPALIPKAKPLQEIDPRLHPMLCEVVMSCIENDPQERPQDMGKVVQGLELSLGKMRHAAKGKSKGKPAGSSDSQLLVDAGSMAGTRTGVKLDSRSSGSSVQGVRLDNSSRA